MRYYLLDKITAIEVGKEARGVKCLSLTDQFFHDHFPDYPVFPGALLTEALAQLAGFLLETAVNKEDSAAPVRRAVLAQIEKMKFYSTSGPGDRLDLRVTVDSLLGDAAKVSVSAEKEGERIASGKILFALMKIDSAKVTAQRLELYKIWTRELKNCPPLR